MEGNDTPCICQIYECISCSAPRIYLAAGSALQPVHTTMLMRGVSGKQSQSTERRGEWSWTRSAVGNDNIQRLSTKGPEQTHINTHIKMACKNAQSEAARGLSLWMGTDAEERACDSHI